MPTVSIIIPNYNHAPYLKQRIDSVLEQTYQDFEVILLDDCSTDNSRAVIEQYRNHPKVNQIIYNENNSGGVFKQWIKGMELAKGKYVWIAESDDYAAPNFLQTTVAVLDADAYCGMVFTASTTVDESGTVLTTTEKTKPAVFAQLESEGNTINARNLAHFLIAELVIENASSVLFRRESLLGLDLQELRSFRNTGDRFAYIGIALKSTIQYVPHYCNYMRSHQRNTTKQSFANGRIYRDRMRVLNFYMDDFLSYGSNPQIIADFYRKDLFLFMNWGTYEENIQLLNNVKKTKNISTFFYHSVKQYLYCFKKQNLKLRLFRSVYYRMLLWQQS